MTSTRTTRLVVVALLMSLLLAACGGDEDSPEAQPSTDGGTFVSGDFGDIPIHPLADAVGSKSTKGDVIAQSFGARNVSRDGLFDWYEDRLDEWDQVEPPTALGDAPDASTRARWVKDDRQLIMTVSDAPTLQGEDGDDREPTLQYSLSLEPKT